MMIIAVSCFGAFRKFGDNLSLEIPEYSSVQQVKELLVEVLGENNRALVEDSVLASDAEILPNSYLISEPVKLFILPPVCGG